MFRVSGQCSPNASPLEWPAVHVMSQGSSDSTGVSTGVGHSHLPLPGHKHWQVKWEERWRGVSVTCVMQSLGRRISNHVATDLLERKCLLWCCPEKVKGIQHQYGYRIPWIRSGLGHLTCANSPKESWKLLLPLSRDESQLPLWECSLSQHFWVGEGCWGVICETISQF